jgi:beta-glucosidase
LLLALGALCAASPAPAQTLDDRIEGILSRMTLEEKILQLHKEGGFNTADNARLGVPGFLMADGPHGVRDGLATSFPVSIGMAATWDTELAFRVGEAMGKEFRGKGKSQALGPSMDLDRDPRNGRGPETGGEDPYLCAWITTAVVRGIQSTGCIATAKHYNANHRENGRTDNNIVVSRRHLMEHVGLQFRTAVQEGGALSVMNAYNLINGEKCAENTTLLTTILRQQWGFPYYVVSDWGSIWNSERAIEAGCDVCMGSDNYQNDLPGLMSSGAVSQATLDEAVRRVLRTKAIAGLLDHYPSGDPSDVNSGAHQQLCLDAGRRALVLLRNQGNILPLNASTLTSLALVGPHALVSPVDGSGSAYVTPYYSIGVRDGIQRITGASKVQYAKGCDVNSADTSGFAAAAAIAQAADIVVYVGGLDGTQEGEGFDRVGGLIDLPGKQQDLINRLAAVNPNIVVVLFSGGVCGISRCEASIRGFVQAFYPGQEAGNAIAEVLFGITNPGGKLPVTYPLATADLPAWNDDFDDDFGGGYRWFDATAKAPLFAFGHGLSYTSFDYSNLAIVPAAAAMGEHVTVSVDVTNSGARAGDEVVQLYLRDDISSVPMPLKALKGFRRVTLGPGETRTVSMQLTPEELYFYDDITQSYQVEPGTFTVFVGGASDNLRVSKAFEVLDGERKPDLRVTGIRTVPAFPLVGDTVIFLATVKNHGTGPTAQGVPVKVRFDVDGAPHSWSDTHVRAIPQGGLALVCANAGVAGTNGFIVDAVGSFTVAAVADPDGLVAEGVEDNNSFAIQMKTRPVPPPNRALRRSVTVSSVEGPGLEGDKAVDGQMGTRWSSQFSDPQVITVDLGEPFDLNEIALYWEAAYARSYVIQTSPEGSNWTIARNETAGDGGIDRIPVSVRARYLKVIGVQRATQWGYSLFEIEAYGSPVTDVSDGASNRPRALVLHQNYPNPFNPETVIRFEVPAAGEVRLSVYDLLGREVAVLVDGYLRAGVHTALFDGRNVSSGAYFLKLQSGASALVRTMVLQR